MRALLLLAASVAASLPGVASAQQQLADVPVLARAIARGERIDAADFAREQRPASAARLAVRPADVSGMEATRNLMAGTIVRQTDVMQPQLVKRGEPVSVRYVSGGLVIASAGRALGGGGKGDLVRVVVGSTNRTLDATVESSGTVRVVAP